MLCDPPPDAGRSYLGVYGVTNPWTCWLIGMSPELVADDAALVSVADRMRCRTCRQPMRLRPGRWMCWNHDPPVTVRVKFEYEPAPEGDVLSRLDQMLDYVWDDDEGRYVVTEVLRLPENMKTPVPRK